MLHAGIAASLRAARSRGQRRDSRGARAPAKRTPSRALRSGRWLLVDQLEEVFAPGVTAESVAAYLDTLASAAVVEASWSSRSGPTGPPSSSGEPELARVLERGWYVLAAMAADDLRPRSRGPARQAGLLVEPGLVDLLRSRGQDEPGALPLLSHALLETWQRREGRTLTVAGYRASGGIRGRWPSRPKVVYGHEARRNAAPLRDLLAATGLPGTRGRTGRAAGSAATWSSPTPSRSSSSSCSSRPGWSPATTASSRSPTRRWPERGLGYEAGWRTTSRANGSVTTSRPPPTPGTRWTAPTASSTAASGWPGRSTGSADKDTALTEVERQFLETSSHHAEAEQQSIVERARAQARLIRRLRIALGGAAVLLVLALVAGALAAVQSDRANGTRPGTRTPHRREQAAVSADARRVGARAQLTDDISLSLLLAAAGARLDDSPETRVNLVTALAKRPTLVRSAPPEGGYMEAFDVSRDGRWIASSDDQNRMHLYDASTNRLLRSYDAGRPSRGRGVPVGVQPRQQAARRDPGGPGSTEPVRLLDPNTMQPTTKLDVPGSKPVWGVRRRVQRRRPLPGRHRAHGRLAGHRIPASAPGYALVWDLHSPSTPPVRVPTGTDTQGMALSPDGQSLYTAWPLTAYDVATGKRIWRREDVTSRTALDVNAKGTLLAVADTGIEHGKDALLVSASNGATVRTLRGHRERSATSGSRPTARWWGRSPRTASSSSGIPPPAGRWNGGTPSTRGVSASARTMTWSTGAAATRCCAPGTCPWRTPICSGRPRSATPRCSRTPTSPRTGSRWPTAGSTGTRDGSGSSTPTPAKRPHPRACRCHRAPGPAAPGIPRVRGTSPLA